MTWRIASVLLIVVVPVQLSLSHLPFYDIQYIMTESFHQTNKISRHLQKAKPRLSFDVEQLIEDTLQSKLKAQSVWLAIGAEQEVVSTSRKLLRLHRL